MTLVFLSSPYSHPSAAVMEDRTRIAGDACAWLYREGYLPVSPIVHWHHAAIRNGLPSCANAWIDWNRRWLEAADAVAFLHIDGWENSAGMAMERQWAHEAGIREIWVEPYHGTFRITARDFEAMDPYGPQNHPLPVHTASQAGAARRGT